MDCSLPGFPIHEIFQARVLEWVAISFSRAKETKNKMKKHPTDWEKLFANNATNKTSMSKIYEQLIQLTKKNKKNTQTTQLKTGQKT